MGEGNKMGRMLAASKRGRDREGESMRGGGREHGKRKIERKRVRAVCVCVCVCVCERRSERYIE